MKKLPARLGFQRAGNLGLSQEDQFEIFDLDSPNSTYVNGRFPVKRSS